MEPNDRAQAADCSCPEHMICVTRYCARLANIKAEGPSAQIAAPADLLTRLRTYRGQSFETTECYNGLRAEAAAEIERLTDVLRRIRDLCDPKLEPLEKCSLHCFRIADEALQAQLSD